MTLTMFLINHLSPEATKPLAIAMPPANSSNIPQGISFADSQSSKREPFPFGTINIITTANKAIVLSPAILISKSPLQPPNGSLRVIHAKAVKPKTHNVLLSSFLH